MIQGETYTVHIGSNLDILPTLPDNSVDSIVTDPPYGLSDNKFIDKTLVRWISGERDFIPDGKGFMGKSWDAFVPPPALWDECLRVLKPGGHLLAFFGSRTQDIGALSIRLAGFEIRDSIAWMYGSGFPKSLDISKAIDKGTGENRQRQLKFVNWMRSTGLTAREANAIVEKADIASHYFRLDQPAIATADLFDKLRPYLPEVPEEIERLVAERTGIEWTAYKNRKKVGESVGAQAQSTGRFGAWGNDDGTGKSKFDITESHTPEAQQWEGWGTALKPAFEPIVVARKPLIGTVAENVLTYGTGGLNIDGSRISFQSDSDRKSAEWGTKGSADGWGLAAGAEVKPTDSKGRWPANVILDPYTAELLDEQSGVSISKSGGMSGTHPGPMDWGKENKEIPRGGFDDKGGASRFFYVAKASKRDRNEGLKELEPQRHSDRENAEGVGGDNPRNRTNQAKQNFHPTVKPTDLMRYLVKLVTPPGGTVLDPFTGSGSTGKAAILEGFDFIGIELTDEYLPIIEGRLAHAEKTKNEEPEGLF